MILHKKARSYKQLHFKVFFLRYRSECSTVVAGNQAVAGSLVVVDLLTPLDKAGNQYWRDMPPADIPDWQAGADNQSREVEC